MTFPCFSFSKPGCPKFKATQEAGATPLRAVLRSLGRSFQQTPLPFPTGESAQRAAATLGWDFSGSEHPPSWTPPRCKHLLLRALPLPPLPRQPPGCPAPEAVPCPGSLPAWLQGLAVPTGHRLREMETQEPCSACVPHKSRLGAHTGAPRSVRVGCAHAARCERPATHESTRSSPGPSPLCWPALSVKWTEGSWHLLEGGSGTRTFPPGRRGRL